MFLEGITTALCEISTKLDILIEARRFDPGEEPGGTEGPEKEKRNEKELREGINNLISYDPFRKKRSEDE
ncbi:hypothetical protein SDC9_62041 [bioreactor metagenome]|uniref:Uncharacterized protein n=1 Tax=bioreactor metagenome TaxID=1076179 RepID=A0A644XHI0_9ZZZZ